MLQLFSRVWCLELRDLELFAILNTKYYTLITQPYHMYHILLSLLGHSRLKEAQIAA